MLIPLAQPRNVLYMAYRATSIANELLDLAAGSGRRLTQIEIQKLVYFVHGWHFAYADSPLIGELFEPWKYGPVVRSLYDAFKKFGSDQITEKAKSWETNLRGDIVQVTPTILSNDCDADNFATDVTRKVWSEYGMLAPFKLVEATHQPDGPWAKAYYARQTYIDNEAISRYFKSLALQA